MSCSPLDHSPAMDLGRSLCLEVLSYEFKDSSSWVWMMLIEPLGIVEFNWSLHADWSREKIYSRRLTCKPELSRGIQDLAFCCGIGTKGKDGKYDLCFWKMNINGHWQWVPLLPKPGDAHPRSLLNEWANKWTLKVYYLGSFVITNAIPTKIQWVTLWFFFP